MTKKGHQKFSAWKSVIQKSWSGKTFSVPPKLGARSPPLKWLKKSHRDFFVFSTLHLK